MNIQEALKHYFGYDRLRTGQDALINGILSGTDAVGIMPTGAGKSLCYQLPALMLEGITLVISPLISLMSDQVTALNQLGIHAAYINSSLSERQIQLALSYAAAGRYKIIYVAPERLGTARFLEFAQSADISMVTVDEAHCISQWGQDFRPSYMEIPAFLHKLPHRPIVSAFTATATEQVKRDIVNGLGLQRPLMVVTGFDRPNLFFRVIHRRGGAETDNSVLNYVKNHGDESGIIYCATRKNVDQLYQLLLQYGIAVGRYHAGLSPEERKGSQEDFIYDRIQVMVATNAFGMGIDKSNVRYVLHYNMPQSLEYYYQEAGRAGRDGEEAECVLFYAKQDIMINKRLLQQKNMIEGADAAPERRANDLRKLNQMIRYCETEECLRQYILSYFGDTSPCSCDKCSNCVITEDETEEVYVKTGRQRRKPLLAANLTAVGQELFEQLRSRRMALARERSVPPYIICSDRTLKDMCAKCPVNAEAMADVYGMGGQKIGEYGQAFASVIAAFLREHPQASLTDGTAAGAPPESSAESPAERLTEGTTEMTADGQGTESARANKKPPFYIDPEELNKTEITDTCMLTELVDRINSLCPEAACKRLTARFVNLLLMEEGYLEETELDGKKTKDVTEKGRTAGMQVEERHSSNGYSYNAIIHTRESQQMILNLLQQYYAQQPQAADKSCEATSSL